MKDQAPKQIFLQDRRQKHNADKVKCHGNVVSGKHVVRGEGDDVELEQQIVNKLRAGSRQRHHRQRQGNRIAPFLFIREPVNRSTDTHIPEKETQKTDRQQNRQKSCSI